MRRHHLLVLFAALGSSILPGSALAAASGIIAANPNPCVIPAGAHECTSYITWSSQGVEHARVYIRAEGKKEDDSREYSASRSCEAQQCKAPWIEADTKYIFTLYDWSSGSRGAALASVTVTGVRSAAGASVSPGSASTGPSGTIAANPNPCVIPAGARECTSYITWSSQNVAHARVYIRAEGKKEDESKEFSASRSCEAQQCKAPWIEADTKYIFTLYDWSSGSRGATLASVTVTGVRK